MERRRVEFTYLGRIRWESPKLVIFTRAGKIRILIEDKCWEAGASQVRHALNDMVADDVWGPGIIPLTPAEEITEEARQEHAAALREREATEEMRETWARERKELQRQLEDLRAENKRIVQRRQWTRLDYISRRVAREKLCEFARELIALRRDGTDPVARAMTDELENLADNTANDGAFSFYSLMYGACPLSLFGRAPRAR